MAQPSPRKFVPLASGHDPSSNSIKSNSSSMDIVVTKRAFFAAVVVEEDGHGISPDAQELITGLGVRITEQTPQGIDRSNSDPSAMANGNVDLHRSATTRRRAMTEGTVQASGLGHKRSLTQTESDTLQDMLREMLTTERTYVKRLRILKEDYADPLRNFSKKKDEALLDKYKAKTLFGNIDQILPVNEAFLNDLEKMMASNGQKSVGGLGDICLKHFRDKKAFECYKLYYAKREEAQTIFEDEMAKGSKSGFPAYIERVKYSSADVTNRVGLRELLAEPIQRIPRYTMMWQNMIKEMDDSHPQKAKLVEAEKIAGKIALCESDDQTKRATTMYCLERTIDGFPPGLISNGRKFIDCIDVDDIPTDIVAPASSSASTASGVLGVLHCTLFLFDDRLIIVKRPHGGSSGRALARLDDIEKLLRTNGLGTLKKTGMSCKGVVDVLDVTAADASGPEIHMYLENPPQDQTDRWNFRPFRSYAVALPPSPVNMDPTATQAAKKRFLENLWTVQALYRVRNARCVVLKSDTQELEGRGGRTTHALAYYNLYQRTPYLAEPKKPKIVVHIDSSNEADRIPFGIVGGPFVVIRLQPMPGGLCRYNVTCNSLDEDEEEHILHSEVVPGRILQTIHQFGLFSFSTTAASRPTTPTAASKSRAAVFGLDAISRTLMGSRSGDAFSFSNSMSGTVSGTRRSKGATSRSSTQTMSTSLTESTNRFSYRSHSTVATSDEDLNSLKSPVRLLRQGRSPGSISDGERPSHASEPISRSSMDQVVTADDLTISSGSSDDVTNRAPYQPSELFAFTTREPPFADTIYEEDPPPSRAGFLKPLEEEEETGPFPSASTTPTKTGKPLPRRPGGPRRSALSEASFLPEGDLDAVIEETIAAFSPPHFPIQMSEEDTPTKPILAPTEPDDAEKTLLVQSPSSASSVEPLAIKKKSSIKPRRSPDSFRRIPVHEPISPTATKGSRAGSQRSSKMGSHKGKEVDRMVIVAKTTKEDLSSARRAVKRIKQEVDVLRQDVTQDGPGIEYDRSGAISPVGGTRGVVRSPPTRQMNRAAEARMEEMQQMLDRRQKNLSDGSVRRPSIAMPTPLDPTRLQEWAKTVDTLIEDADQQIAQAIDQSDALVKEMALLSVSDDDSGDETEQLRADLHGSKRQAEVLKQLLQDATAENEVLYSAFNQELDSMYQDMQLPEDQAWAAMINDLKSAKQTRNKLSKENFHIKQRLEVAEQRNEELLALLKAHGLEPGH